MGTKRSEARSFATTKRLYGAVIDETRELILVVEAGNAVEASNRVKAVLPFFGLRRVSNVSLVEMDSCPQGIASFFDSFFEGAGLGAVRDSVVPSTDTRQ